MAIAACMACVDLNPVRVALAETAEASAFTSVQDCVIDRQSALSAASPDVADQQAEHGPQAGRQAGWLRWLWILRESECASVLQCGEPAIGVVCRCYWISTWVWWIGPGVSYGPLKLVGYRRICCRFWNAWTAVRQSGWIWSVICEAGFAGRLVDRKVCVWLSGGAGCLSRSSHHPRLGARRRRRLPALRQLRRQGLRCGSRLFHGRPG